MLRLRSIVVCPPGPTVSSAMAQLIDREVKNFLFTAYNTAKKIISQRRKKLKEIAERLIEKETIERDEFEMIMAAA